MRRWILIIWVCFMALQAPKWAGTNPNGIDVPVEAKNATEATVGVPGWVKDRYPDKQIREYDYTEGDLFDKYFGADARIMRAICKAENTSQDPTKISKQNRDGTRDFGLCQVNSIHKDKVGNLNKLLDPETNIRVSKEIKDLQGFRAWVCYKNGAYKKYL